MARKNKISLNKKSVFKRETCPEGWKWDPWMNQCVLDTPSSEDDPSNKNNEPPSTEYGSSSLVGVPDLSDDDIKKYRDIWITLSDPEKEVMAKKYGKTKEEVEEMFDQYNQSSSTNTQDGNSSQGTTDGTVSSTLGGDVLGDDLNIDDDLGGGTDKKSTSSEDIFDDSLTFKSDAMLGVGAGAIGPKTVNQKAVNDYLAQIEKPASTSIYDQLAARYRSQGEGAVLRTQKNLENLFQPTITLIKEREALAKSRFTLMKNRMPEFDESTIFGDLSGNPMPILEHVQGISTSVKEDLRMLSRLNPDDERYDEIRKRVEKNQDTIVNFDKINQQLLKIRNAGTDESQWSDGMDDTTKAMWRDIYLSNGKNIKLVDGKLIWTDEKGTTINTYNIPDDNTRDKPHDDETYDILSNSKGDDKTSEQYKRGSALSTLHWYSDQVQYNPNTKVSKWSKINVEKTQKALNSLGITDGDGNALEVDGDWGPKTQEAYDKYLKNKENLNKHHLDQYMTKEDAEKYRTSKTTGVGDTKIVDLSQIGDGPVTIDNIGVKTDMEIQDAVQVLINSDIKMDDPAYERKVKGLIFRLNEVGPEGIKSLIFDGIGTDSDNLFQSSNTDSFIKGVIRNHYGDKLSASEIAEKIDEMKSGDVTKLYKNGKGGTTSLQTQFMEWYKNDIDERVREGKKSKLGATARTGTSSSSSSSSGRIGKAGDEIINANQGGLKEALRDNGAQLVHGDRGGGDFFYSGDKTARGGDVSAGEIWMDTDDLEKIIQNSGIEDLENMTFDDDIDYKLTNDNILQWWDEDNKEWVDSKTNADTDSSKKIMAYRELLNHINSKGGMTMNTTDIVTFYNPTRREFWEGDPGYNFDFGDIRDKGSLGGNEYILDYDDADLVTERLNNAYGNVGFEFTDEGSDEIRVTATKGTCKGRYYVFVTDRAKYNDAYYVRVHRTKDENKLIAWMENTYEECMEEGYNSDTYGEDDKQAGEVIKANKRGGVWYRI